MNGSWYWLDHPHHGWIPVQVLGGNGDSLIVRTPPPSTEYFEINASDLTHVTIPDICINALENSRVSIGHESLELTEELLLQHLRVRFLKGSIFTDVQDCLVYVNPFKPSSMTFQEYLAGPRHAHIYDLVSSCHKALFTTRRDQSIIVSGSSGSGRSGVVCMALDALTQVCSGKFEFLLSQARVVLDAFTVASIGGTDSRRCALWFEILYPSTSYQPGIEMSGCNIFKYHFERSRVARSGPGKCNFNILYQLSKAAKIDSHEFPILAEANQTDFGSAEATQNALGHLGFTREEIQMVFKVLSAILLLSRLTFSSDGRTCHINEPAVVKKCASLLGILDHDLEKGLVSKVVVSGQAEVVILFSTRAAQDGRDVLVGALYSSLFDWILTKVNVALHSRPQSAVHESPSSPLVQPLPLPPEHKEGDLALGILDMFGFERGSSLDHLIANYASEQLHGFFLSYLLTTWQRSYLADGLTLNEDVPSNEPALQLLNDQTGLLGLIQKESQGSDSSIIANISAQYRGHRLLAVKKHPKHHFTITHYGRKVRYRVQGFAERLASCNACILDALKESELRVLGSLFEKPCISTGFDTLLSRLGATEPHFVKCIQPNFCSLPDYFHGVCVSEQLHDLGLRDLTEMQKLGFPIRMTPERFCEHYHSLLELPFCLTLFASGDSASVKTLKFLESQEFAAASWRVSTTMVFLDSQLYTTLEEFREAVFVQVIVPLQALIRGRNARRKFRSLKAMRILARTLLKELPQPPKQPSRQAILELRQALKAMKPLEEYQPDLYLRLKKVKHRVRRVQQVNDALQWAIHFPRGPQHQTLTEPLFKDIPLLQQAIDITKAECKLAEDKPNALKEAEVKVKDWPAFLSCIPDAIKNRNLLLLRNQVKAAREFKLVDDLPSQFQGLIARLAQEEQLANHLKEARGDELRIAVIACGKAGYNTPEIEASRARLLDHRQETEEPVVRASVKLPPPIPMNYWDPFELDEAAMGVLIFEAAPVIIEHPKAPSTSRQRARDNAIAQLRNALELNDLTKIAEYVHELTPDALFLPTLLKDASLPLQPRTEILQQIQHARESFNDSQIPSLLETAFCLGLEAHPSVSSAIAWCDEMRDLRKLFCVMRLVLAIGEVHLLSKTLSRSSSTTTRNLLRGASPQQQELHGRLVTSIQERVHKAHLSQQHRRQREVAQSCRRVKRRDVRPTASLGSDEERFAMYNFPSLRDPADFSKAFFAIKKLDKQRMLQFSDQPIAKSLTQLHNTKYKKPALQAFKNLLAYMGDAPAEQRPDVIGASVLQCPLEFPQLGDEILVQLMKQVTMNPNADSTLKGWELLGMAVHVFHPSNLLQPYFLNFLYSTTCDEKAPERVYGYARYVMYKMKYPDLSVTPPPTTVSADALARFRARNMTSDLVRIHFADGTWMQLLAHPWHKAADTLETVRGWLGLEPETKKDEKDFALFLTRGTQHTLIDANTSLLDLLPKPPQRFEFRLRITPLSVPSSPSVSSLIFHDAVSCLCQHPTLYSEETRVFVIACHQLLYDQQHFVPLGNTNGKFLVDAGGELAQTRSWLPVSSKEGREDFQQQVRLKKLELIANGLVGIPAKVLLALQQSPIFGAVCFSCEMEGKSVETGIGPFGVVLLAASGWTHIPLADIAHCASTDRSFQLNLRSSDRKSGELRDNTKTQYYFTTSQGAAMQSMVAEYTRNSSRRNSST